MKNAAILFSILLFTASSAFAQNKSEPIVVISTTYGDITLKLYNETPLHRDNFLALASKGRYDGSIFHRVISNFMIQGGGSASLSTIDGRPEVPAEINPKFIHKKGALAAARTPDHVNPERKSSGSQFYIVQGKTYGQEILPDVDKDGVTLTPERKAEMMTEYWANISKRSGVTYTQEQQIIYAELGGTPHLDMGYTVFGEVISGLDVVDKIAAVKKQQADRPVEDIIMTVKVFSK